MQSDNSVRNLIIAMIAMGGIMMVWQIFVWGPQTREAQEAYKARQAAIEASQPSTPSAVDTSASAANDANQANQANQANDTRIAIDAPSVDGSLLLRGSRIDQIKLKRHFETLEDKEAKNVEGEVEVLHPQSSGKGYYASLGWTTPENGAITDANTNWALTTGQTLTPNTPLTLSYEGDGVSIERIVEVDENYMFTFTDKVTNTSGSTIALQPYGVLRQFGVPQDLANFYILHEGLVGAVGGELILKKYSKLEKGEGVNRTSTEGGWIGLTDKYWLSALIPDQSLPFTLDYRTIPRAGAPVLQARMVGAEQELTPGATITSTNRVFAGAKRNAVLTAYEKELSIPRFNDAIDWGSMFFWLTKPFFTVLSWINGYVGNFGVSILLLTVLVKLVFFPIQNRAYVSMAKMKDLQEPMKELRERFAADKQRQQQEIMKLYQEKKVNPVAGCLPVLIQIPVFYALYKTLFVTIEMRHEPFVLWIKDLSAPDPTAIGNLFGLLPFSAETVSNIPLLGFVLGVGVLPIMYGVTMWALQSLNPPAPDPTQRMIFQFLPIVFTFVFAGFAAGLVVYWTWSNILSIAQQYMIMRQNGVKTELDKWIEKRLNKDKAA